MSSRPPAGVGSELACAEDDISSDGKCSSLNRCCQLGSTRVGVYADVAEVVAKLRVEKLAHGLCQWLATVQGLNSGTSTPRENERP